MAVASAPASNNAQALFKKGVAAHLTGKVTVAADFYRQAIDHDPGIAEAHNNLATACSQLGDDEGALRSLQRAVELNPDYAEAQSNLGILWAGRGRHDIARPYLERAVALECGHEAWFNNLANAYLEEFRFADALTAYDRGLALNPASIDCWSNRGLALRGLRRTDDAIASIERALHFAPSHVNSLSNLAIVLKEEKRFPEAVSTMRKATDIDPANASLWVNLAAVYEAMGEFEKLREAAICATHIDPDFVEAYNLLANYELEAGRHDDAEALYLKVVTLDPSNRNANWNLALIWLMRGDFERGWKQFEWRKRLHSVVLDRFDYGMPEWDGTPLDGRDILLHSEQGVGDAIQFARFAATVKARGAGRVYLECPYPVVPLLSGVTGIDAVVARGAPLPAFAVHASLMSLPLLLGTTLDTIPAAVPYIPVEPRTACASVVARRAGLKVGIVWAGNPGHARDYIRSVPLQAFHELFGIEGTHFFSLQKGASAESQLTQLPRGLVTDLAGELEDFRDTAAVLAALDLVITVDTSVAHLAGALGRPTWLLLPHVTDFRWMLERNDSPWYPSMRLFRQPVPRDWESVFAEVAEALRTLARGSAQALEHPAQRASDDGRPGVVHDTVVTLSSATFLHDGRHRFDLWLPLARLSDATLFAEYKAELLHGGHDPATRRFLDEALQEDDAFIDVAPGLGLVALSAITAPRPPALVAIVEREASSAARLSQLVLRRAPATAFTAGHTLDEVIARVAPAARVFVRIGDDSLTDAVADCIGRLDGARRPAALLWTSMVPAERDGTLRFLESLGYVLASLSLHDGEASLDAIEDDARAQGIIAVLPATLDALSAEHGSASPFPVTSGVTAAAVDIRAVETTAPRASAPAVRPVIGIDWELRYDTGWGVYGTNLALELQRGGHVQPAIFSASAEALPILTRASLAPLLRDTARHAARLREAGGDRVHFDGLVLRALGNNFEMDTVSERAIAPRNVGVIFFEDTMLDAAALARARAFDL
ncbi:MAG: tetratricopeptide repeat protein, partial [Gemmatimonadaceae bacterium]